MSVLIVELKIGSVTFSLSASRPSEVRLRLENLKLLQKIPGDPSVINGEWIYLRAVSCWYWGLTDPAEWPRRPPEMVVSRQSKSLWVFQSGRGARSR
ncbi:hypothetical protein Pyn_24101 [Prunus yedoensis var. nudiflora]|uniref:Uncharacterized protein n=1 Tax=Prunus yedoensis var. nudiflora TaxID=2094558 RepID=A0A314ZHN0_PRUYE|nr:hypothetical protein Pyn_24101 [Prunus yedoensis var. nudiflora]